MGTSYANTFMARLEEKHIKPLTKGRLERYLRYADNIFDIWKGTEKEMQNFFNQFNKKHPSIKFDPDPKYSISDFEFFDVLVHKDEEERLQTTIFKKKTNRQSYLHATSDHLASMKKKYSVQSNTAFQRIFSTNSEFDCNWKVLHEQFTKRAYHSLQL